MEIFTTDVLILGGGLSAYMAAYTMLKKRKKDRIMIVSPGRGGESARGLDGMALPRMDGDTIGQYTRDTLAAGARQNDPALVKALCEESAQIFDRARAFADFGPPEEGGRFRPVIGYKKALWQELSANVGKYAQVKEGCHGLRLFVQDDRIQGALCYDEPNRAFFAVSVGTVVLATGGYSDLYRENMDEKSLRSAGSGLGLAYFAGAELADLEFTAATQQGVVTLGGVVIDSQCHTSVPGLLACGGVAAGVHGAGYLKGNAETAALVFGRRAGQTLARMDFLPGADEETLYKWAGETVFVGQREQSAPFSCIRKEIAHTLNLSAGEIRTQEKIEDGLKIIARLQHELNELDLCPLRQVYEKMELEFALIAARLTLLASLEREECCGCFKRAATRPAVQAAEENPALEEQPDEAAPEEEAVPAEAGETADEAPDSDAAVVCEPAKEPEGEQITELVEKEVSPYRVMMKLENMILTPRKEPWKIEE